MRAAVLVTPKADAIPVIEGALYIGIDAGALLLRRQGLPCHLAIGDFDSLQPGEETLLLQAEKIRRYPVAKDETDTQLALEASRDCSPRYLCGAFGGRLDHTLANLILMASTCPDVIALSDGQYARIYGPGYHRVEKIYRHVSFFPLAQSYIRLEGFAYNLDWKQVGPKDIFMVSNHIEGHEGILEIEKGSVLCVQSEHS